MIRIVCGEDSVSARNYIMQVKTHYKQKSYIFQDISPSEIFEIQKEGEYSAGLFGEQRIFFVRNLYPYLSRSRKFTSTIQQLAQNQNVYVIDWEEGKSLYELSIKDKSLVKEFKPTASIFAFLDACVPKNRDLFLSLLRAILQTQEAMFAYTMVCKHVRSLLMAKHGTFAERTAPWQKKKLGDLAKKWDTDKLVQFYEGLIKIDQTVKTSSSPFSVQQSLEILAVYYL